MRAFLCHSHEHSDYVIEVAKYLKPLLSEGVFYYEERKQDPDFVRIINKELDVCEKMIVFAADKLSEWQEREINSLIASGKGKRVIICSFVDLQELPSELTLVASNPKIKIKSCSPRQAAIEITGVLGVPFLDNGLPLDPHLFSYEKHIIDHFVECSRLNNEPAPKEIVNTQLNGCPITWPRVKHWMTPGDTPPESDSNEQLVLAAALAKYHHPICTDGKILGCMTEQRLCFPEAVRQKQHYFPRRGQPIRIGIVVSGGIAPGINAVIDGIVKRHQSAANERGYLGLLSIFGIRNGFLGFDFLVNSMVPLGAVKTSKYVGDGGSFLGTSRCDDLMVPAKRHAMLTHMVRQLEAHNIDLLYIIGGDGSMKAAHALWTVANDMYQKKEISRRISIVGVPKTMDNDILWVWQSFGFLSAVEKAREIVEHLWKEVESNPRLGIIQLFGSDSGFIVSHTVLATRCDCDAALIPEIEFSMKALADYLRSKMRERACGNGNNIPQGLVVMAETAIPTDAEDYVHEDSPNYIDVGLNRKEREAIEQFVAMRKENRRIQGQTNDSLRSAGLKIVKQGLEHLLGQTSQLNGDPDWSKLRVFTNEPRHLLRAIPPSSTDIIYGNRLGMLAVDNALAGYTDFMISQWLTEYVLVPLELVVLGRKRIPDGLFWQSVRTKTGQPRNLV